MTLEFDDGTTLIIENKVKSLPDKNQLVRYAAKVPDKRQTTFLLLSLPDPYFLESQNRYITLPDGTVWTFVNYERLAELLQLVLGLLTENGESEVKAYHRLILQDYIEFVHNLSKIAKLFSLESGDKEGDFLLSIPFFGL